VRLSDGRTLQATVKGCHDDARNERLPSTNAYSCCDDCTLTSAPGLRASPISAVIERIEIGVQWDFQARLGRDLDRSPDDLRSRAPPQRA
jgi:hypothetical protein